MPPDELHRRVQGHPGHEGVRRHAVAPRLPPEHVLHVADEGGEPRRVQGGRARVSAELSDDRGAARGGARPRLQPDDRARRQHLLPRQDRRDRRLLVPVPGVEDDRHAGGRIQGDDAGGRPLPAGQPQQVRQERSSSWRGSPQASRRRTSRPIGAAIDLGKTQEPYWQPVFAGYEFSKRWIAEHKPDVVILVYNDHASAFSLEMIPTFALGCAEEFAPADEGWGPRPVPVVQGHPELAWHMAQSPILDEFDMTIVNRMDVDHGLTVPLSLMFGQPKAWPCGDPARGQRRAVPAADGPSLLQARQGDPQGGRVVRRGSERGDLGHGRHVAPAPGSARRPHQPGVRHALPRRLTNDPEGLAQIPHLEYVREAGSEGIELVMWLIMRGALDAKAREVYRFYHVPASNTAVGHIILENPAEQRRPVMKIGLAGAGAFGVKHLEAIAKIDGVEVVSLVGRSSSRRRRSRDKFGIPHVDDRARRSARPARTSTPRSSPRRRSSTRSRRSQCLRAGKHVQIEIPLADNLADAEAVARRAAGDRARRDGRTHAPLQSRAPVGAPADRRRTSSTIQQMDVQTYLLPAHEHQRARASRGRGPTICSGTTRRTRSTSSPTRRARSSPRTRCRVRSIPSSASRWT